MHFYRFTEGKFGYPTMIELFSRKLGYLLEIEEGIIPIHIDDDTSSLSAILLNDDYYKFMMSGRRVVDGIGVLGAEHLIPFKMYAWINLLERKRAGEHVNEKDLKKHKYDVFRLLQIVTAGTKVESEGLVTESIHRYIEEISVLDELEARLLQMGMPFDRDKERNMLDILIVEDNKEIGNLLCDFLRKENYTVSVAQTGEKALELYEKYGARVIVLDIMLPGMDGFAVCSKIRETSNTHILIASAKVEKNDKLKGLNLGADDYIEKPYDVDILIAKINGIFKRKYGQLEIVEGNIRLNTVQQSLYVDGQKKEVTEKEFELLKLLIENKNVTMKKEYLFNTVWGSDSNSEIQTLTVHIKWLREKIEEEPKKPKHIITEWGVGYRFE